MTTHAQRLHQAIVHAEKLADAAYDAAKPNRKAAAYFEVYQREILAFAELEAMRTPEEICKDALHGHRWYCSERCLNRGERMYRGRTG